ncbi:hypothetical protein [Rhodoplanes sp. Z2-YC6860]|uniref:hypothetical protein n=1 Tax=Rhodoplanes sp. Z2-YC6860 TaxID=674703 RepID=UPI00078D5476|nr:hypothetical protein [Rhodoplanes sp. Z2-YC6860]AMN44108.1 hypothetical protein RHPLAN_56940 [Rhodoplanes sp. Z2-YC6860]
MFAHRAKRVGIAVALSFILAGLTVSVSLAQPAKSTATASEGHSYFIEFRVATIGAYGHSYAAYGAGSRVKYTDLHPMGNYAIMAIGHVLPVPANTEWDPDVLKLPIASRYRVSLTNAQYARLTAAIAKAKTNRSPTWNAVTNNCNHFIGELAEAIGLTVPGSFQVSYAFVPALKALNVANHPDGASTSKRSSKPQAPQT